MKKLFFRGSFCFLATFIIISKSHAQHLDVLENKRLGFLNAATENHDRPQSLPSHSRWRDLNPEAFGFESFIARNQASDLNRVVVRIFWNISQFYNPAGWQLSNLISGIQSNILVLESSQFSPGLVIYPQSGLHLCNFTSEFILKTGRDFSIELNPGVHELFKLFHHSDQSGLIDLSTDDTSLFFYAAVHSINSPELSWTGVIRHGPRHEVDLNSDKQSDFYDYYLLRRYFQIQPSVNAHSILQCVFDPMKDANEDAWITFQDLVYLGKQLNNHRYFGDANGDTYVDQNDLMEVERYLGRGLFDQNPWDFNYPWWADLNGDLVVDSKDIQIVVDDLD